MSGFCDSAHAKFCAESATLRRIEENLPNGAENVKILLIFVNPFTYNGCIPLVVNFLSQM